MMLDHYPNRQYLLNLYSMGMVVNQHTLKHTVVVVVVVHLSRVDVRDDDEDVAVVEGEDGGGDDADFEENEGLIDMIHAVLLKEK